MTIRQLLTVQKTEVLPPYVLLLLSGIVWVCASMTGTPRPGEVTPQAQAGSPSQHPSTHLPPVLS